MDDLRLPPRRIFSVSELCQDLRAVLEEEFDFTWVRGEVSDLRRPPSGHVYFTLKDAEARLRAVLFRQTTKYLSFSLEDGMEILARGRVSLFPARGDLQLLADYLEPVGAGALQLRFEQLKARLLAEGLFDPGLKRALSPVPSRIGLITSPAGAALHDFVRVARRRWPNIDLLLYPARMQGTGAALDVCEGLRELSGSGLVDFIVITRGGGSMEELSAFNSEELARAIRRSAVPVVSAIGHEIDFTIADFAADLRAPTPSAAAEMTVPDKGHLAGALGRLTAAVYQAASRQVAAASRRHDAAVARLVSPGRALERQRQYLDRLRRLLHSEATEIVSAKGWILRRHAELLDHLGPARQVALKQGAV
ncbi:MAG: exodeoxyribonuclease VII large subunit, partial [Pseudomonadota bacterium]